MFFRLGLFISVSISVLIHLALLIYVPALSRVEFRPEQLNYTEIELRALPDHLPEPKEITTSSQDQPDTSYQNSLFPAGEEITANIPKDSIPTSTREVTTEPEPDQLLVLREFTKSAEEINQEKLPPQLNIPGKPSQEELLAQAEKFNLSTFRELPAPSLNIPMTNLKNREEEFFTRFSKSMMTQVTPDKIGRNPFPAETLETHFPSGLEKIPAREKVTPLKTEFKLAKEVPARSYSPPKKGEGLGEFAEEIVGGSARPLEIKGPVAKRAIIYRPPIPKVGVEVTTDIQLKFWVSPDGTVGRVITLVKGDSRLEAEAIKYIKQWKFAPLASAEKQEEQWGTIPIKFLLG